MADALSRLNHPTALDNAVSEVVEVSLQTLDYAQLAMAQANDEEIQRLLAHPEQTGLKLKKVPINDGHEIICDASTGRDRP